MTTHTQTEAKSTSTLIPAMQPAHSSLLPQLELEKPARSLLPTVDWLQSPSSSTPPPVNPSVGHSFGSMALGSTTSPVLQRMASAGNGIVQRQENPEEEKKDEETSIQAKAIPGQELTSFSQRYGQMVTQSGTRNAARIRMLQRKLAIGQPNDQYEQEAFRVAVQVTSMSDAASSQPIQRQSDEEDADRNPLRYGEEKLKNYGLENTSDIKGDQKDEQKLVPSVRYEKGKWSVSVDVGKGDSLTFPTEYPHKVPHNSPLNDSLTHSIEEARQEQEERKQLQEKTRLLEEEMRRKEKEFRQQNWGNDFPLPRPDDEATAYG